MVNIYFLQSHNKMLEVSKVDLQMGEGTGG